MIHVLDVLPETQATLIEKFRCLASLIVELEIESGGLKGHADHPAIVKGETLKLLEIGSGRFFVAQGGARPSQHCEHCGPIDHVVHLLAALKALSIVKDRLHVVPLDLAVDAQEAERVPLARCTFHFLEDAQALLQEETRFRYVSLSHAGNGQDPLCTAAPKRLTSLTEDGQRLLGITSGDLRLRLLPGQETGAKQRLGASRTSVANCSTREHRFHPGEAL